jgi:dihydropteroate synthase
MAPSLVRAVSSIAQVADARFRHPVAQNGAMQTMLWQTSRYLLDLSEPKVMGIVNVTPDSFSDGGRFFSSDRTSLAALAHCEELIAQGADLLDIGGESTRPGAPPVSANEELRRVLPVLRHAVTLGVPVSIDTYKPEVMKAALDLGADIVNDVWALRQPGALEVVSRHPRCGVCLMHMHREPQTMQALPMEGDVVSQVRDFLAGRADALRRDGVAANRIMLDAGIGFGKTVAQNFSLLARQDELMAPGYPMLAAWSRKSSLAAVAGLPAESDMRERLVPSITAAVLAVERGVRMVRVHDVRETVQALKIWRAACRSAASGRTTATLK